MTIEGQMRASRLDVRDLRRIVTLAHTRNFTRAAERLGISQSVLTRNIQEMEQQIGLRLFDRDRGGVHVAASALTIIERAAELVQEFDDFSQTLERAAEGDLGQINLGMAPVAAFALLPEICARIISRNTHLETYIPVRKPDSLLRLLHDEEIEVLICPEGALRDASGTKITRMGDLSLALLVRPGHPLLDPDYRNGESGAFPILSASGQYHSVLTATEFTDDAPFPPYFASRIKGGRRIVVEDHQCLALAAERSDAMYITSVLAGFQAIQEKRLVEVVPPPGQQRPSVRLVAHSLERRSLSPAMASVLQQIPTLLRPPRDMPQLRETPAP